MSVLFSMPHARDGGYPIRRVTAALAHPELRAALAGRRALLVVAPSVDVLFDAQLQSLVADGAGRVQRIRCVSGERSKVMPAVEVICEQAFAAGLDRDGVLVAVGGGICCDLVTLAASMFRRGVAHIRVPTTLVGQVDAALGAKGAVNFAGRKNSIGCFHPPELVLIDERLMQSLPEAEVRAGIAEIVKMAAVSDRSLFALVEDSLSELLASRFQQPFGTAGTIVAVAARRMLQTLEGNLFERRGYRRIVDAGHTFSPRLEAASGFGLRHGEAVAVDLALSAAIATRLGILPPAERDRLIGLLAAAGLPTSSPLLTLDLAREALDDAIAHRGGHLHLVLFGAIGTPCFVEDVVAVEGVLCDALGDLAPERSERRREPVA